MSRDEASRELLLCMTELEDILTHGTRYREDITIRVDDYRLRELRHRMRRACAPWIEEKRQEMSRVLAS